MTTSHNCSAKDPSTCRYHGSLSKMEAAESKGDFNAYMAAREELVRVSTESQKGLKKFFNSEERTVPPVVPVEAFTKKEKPAPSPASSSGSSLIDEEERKDVELQRRRVEYLEDSQAVPTPMEAYALWVAVYKSQGGEVSRGTYNYNQLATVFGNRSRQKGTGSLVDTETRYDYEDISWDRWTPTSPDVGIPAGYGSGSLEVFVLPDVVDQPLFSATNDDRAGWEWGHTTVYTLQRDPESGKLVAWTNERHPQSYTDVDQYIRGKSVQELTEALSNKTNNNLSLGKN